MMPIIFTRQPEMLEISGPGVCVYHKHYAGRLPAMPDIEAVEFEHMCETFQRRDYFSRADQIIFVGANKFFTSSTRFHPVFEILQYSLPPSARKHSIDIAPYIGPLWRLFAHWSLSYQPFGGYTYSYLLESHYNAFVEGVRETNPLDVDAIRDYADGHVAIGYQRFFAPARVDVIAVGADIHAEYQRLKAQLFDEHDQIGKIIKGLADFARQVCPARKVPQEHKLFDTPDRIHIIRTDLKVDEYLTGKLLAKIDEVNRVTEVLQ